MPAFCTEAICVKRESLRWKRWLFHCSGWIDFILAKYYIKNIRAKIKSEWQNRTEKAKNRG